MKTKFLAIFVCLFLIPLTSCGSEKKQLSLPERVELLQDASNKYFGVNLIALSLLLDADPGTVYPLDAVAVAERESSFQVLEKAGYLVVDRFNSDNGEFIRVERTKKGEELANLIKQTK